MGIVDKGRSGLALLLSGSVTDRPYSIAVGSGSATFNTSIGSLQAERSGLRATFTTTDASTVNYVTYTSDFSSVAMSGTLLTEFGVFSSGAAFSGTIWNREGFPSITFDGTNELQVQVTWRIF